VALAMAYGRTLAARAAQARMQPIATPSVGFGGATLNPDSWKFLDAPATTQRDLMTLNAGVRRTLCTAEEPAP
jgi:hypothetical protein